MAKMLKIILDWLKKNAALLLGGLAIFVMFACFISGCNYHKNHFKCPEIKKDTVLIYDTIPHYIIGSFPYYLQGKDSIIHDTIPKDIDTLAILHDYYDKHIYDRKWENDTLLVNLNDTITRNEPIGNIFKYKIKIPFTTINNTQDNSIHYTKYIYAGISIPFKDIEYTEFSILSTFKGGYAGIGYSPLQKGVSLKTGIRLFKWQ